MYLSALSDKELHLEYARATADYFKVREAYVKGSLSKEDLQLKKNYVQSVIKEIKRRSALA